ncbi:MAG: hypothetical protein CL946_01245 [Ectothiorhodospiraceae bacterium]|nr:hypothetical protein [Ectothiorhodospiraceae bacterium]
MKKSMLILAALALTLLAFSLNREIPTSAQEEVDITVLIETADTPEDHLKIAEYYEEQAVMMEKKATLHASMAKAYQGGKMAGMSTHCKNLAKESEASAEQYRTMAAEHKKMAQQKQGQDSQQPQ